MAEGDDAVQRQPIQVLQRLGQGAFRILITDAYERRCAITQEKALPVLEAAHIRPVAEGVVIVSATGSCSDLTSTRCSIAGTSRSLRTIVCGSAGG